MSTDGKPREDENALLSARKRFCNLFNALSEDEFTEDDALPDAEEAKGMVEMRLRGEKIITAEEFIEALKTPFPPVEETTQSLISEKLFPSDKSPHSF